MSLTMRQVWRLLPAIQIRQYNDMVFKARLNGDKKSKEKRLSDVRFQEQQRKKNAELHEQSQDALDEYMKELQGQDGKK